MSTGKKQTEEGKKRKKTQKVLFLAVRFPVDGYWGGGLLHFTGIANCKENCSSLTAATGHLVSSACEKYRKALLLFAIKQYNQHPPSQSKKIRPTNNVKVKKECAILLMHMHMHMYMHMRIILATQPRLGAGPGSAGRGTCEKDRKVLLFLK